MSALQDFPRITPFLWFDSNAEEAVAFYLSVFKNSRLLQEVRNTGDAPLTLDTPTITGTGATAYSVQFTQPGPLAPGASTK